MSKIKYLAVVLILSIFSCSGELTDGMKEKYKAIVSSEYVDDTKIDNVVPPTEIVVDKVTYKMSWKDEFDYESVDEMIAPDTKWKVMNQNRVGSFWLKDGVSVQNGNMWIATKVMTVGEIKTNYPNNADYEAVWKGDANGYKILEKDDSTEVAISGSLQIKDDKFQGDKYGLYVARIKMKKESRGHWNAFWLIGTRAKESDASKGSNVFEFDIFEYNRTDNKFDQTNHWSWNKSSFRNSSHLETSVDNIFEWNTYAILWTPERVVIYKNWEVSYIFDENYFYGNGLSKVPSVKALKSSHGKVIADIPLQLKISTEISSGTGNSLEGVGWAKSWVSVPDIAKLKASEDKMIYDYVVRYSTDELDKE